MKKGEILKVKNTKRRRNSNEYYYALRCEQNELPVNLLLTENQIAEKGRRSARRYSICNNPVFFSKAL